MHCSLLVVCWKCEVCCCILACPKFWLLPLAENFRQCLFFHIWSADLNFSVTCFSRTDSRTPSPVLGVFEATDTMLHPSAFSSASTVQFVDNEVASAFGGLQSYNQSSGFQHFQQQQQQQQYNQQQQHHFHHAQVDQQQNGLPDVFEGFADSKR